MKEHLVPVYIENIMMILVRLSRYKSRQASFVYRHPSHSWLLRPEGYQVAIESRVLEKALKHLDALIEVDRSISRKALHSQGSAAQESTQEKEDAHRHHQALSAGGASRKG